MDDKITLSLPATALLNQQYQNQKIGRTLQLAQNSATDPADTKLQAACTEMESLFINYLFKEMRATVDKSGFISGGRAEEIFTSMLDEEISRKMSVVGGIGLSAVLLEQLGRKGNTRGGADSQ